KDKEIEAMQNYLVRLKERYKETYPDVVSAEQQLSALKKQRDDIQKEDASKKPEAPRPLPPNPLFIRDRNQLDAQISRLSSLQEAKDMEMKDLQKQSAQINESLKALESRVQASPLGNKEWTELISDRELAWKSFQDADAKLSMSKKSLDVTKRQEGERLVILDPPNVPQTPTEPKRPVIILVG